MIIRPEVQLYRGWTIRYTRNQDDRLRFDWQASPPADWLLGPEVLKGKFRSVIYVERQIRATIDIFMDELDKLKRAKAFVLYKAEEDKMLYLAVSGCFVPKIKDALVFASLTEAMKNQTSGLYLYPLWDLIRETL